MTDAWAGTVAAAVCLAAVGAVAAVVAVRRRVFVVTVRGTSMEPTFRPGDRVLARRREMGAVRVGDVVIIGERKPPTRVLARASFRHAADTTSDPSGGSWIIKRVAAIPGDPVPREGFAALAHVDESVVPEMKLVVLGDSARSADSRQNGYYDGGELASVVLRKLGGTVDSGSTPRAAERV